MRTNVVVLIVGVLFMVAVIIVVAVVLAIRLRSAARTDAARHQGLDALARQYGWQYVTQPDRAVQRRYTGEPFRTIGLAPVFDLVTGRHRGRDFLAFQIVRPSGPASAPTAFTHVAVPLPGAAPRVEIAPRRNAIAEAFTGPAFRLGEPAFDARFTVRAGDDAYARALLQPGLTAWLTRLPYACPLVVDRAELRTWGPGKISAETLPPLLDYLCAALERVPAQVWPAG